MYYVQVFSCQRIAVPAALVAKSSRIFPPVEVWKQDSTAGEYWRVCRIESYWKSQARCPPYGWCVQLKLADTSGELVILPSSGASILANP